MATEKQLDVVIRAREAMNAGLNSALQKIKSFRSNVDAASGGGDGFGLASVIPQVAAIAAAIKGVEVSLKAARSVIAYWQGDLKKVEESFQALPLGIGQIVRGVIDVHEALTGVRAAAESLAAVEKLQRDATASRVRFMQAYAIENEKILGTLRLQTQQILAANDGERERLRIAKDLEDAAREYAESVAKGAGTSEAGARLGAMNNKLKAELQVLAEKERDELTKARQEQANAEAESIAKAAEKAAKRAEQARRAELEKTAEALREQISAEEKALHNALLPKSRPELVSISNRFRDVGAADAINTQKDMLRVAKEQTAKLKSLADKLDEIKRALRERNDGGGYEID